jgi:hypothetical protein
MISKKTTILTIPLFPYLQAGRRKPQETKRIRPEDALDLKRMLKEIRKSEVTAFNIAGNPWSLTSVFSSYSPDVHVMFLESSDDRYIPGPERIPDREGERLMKLWAATLESISKRKTITTVHAGYNWSPRAWGKEEEKTGFQSLPTKWHPHLWGWPAFGKSSSFARSVETSTLAPGERRLLGDNNYAKPFGLLIKKRMTETFPRGSLFCKLFPQRNWHIDGRGIYTRFPVSVLNILRTPEFFSQVLKPLAVMLEEIMRELTETFTTIRCRDIDRALTATEQSRPKNLEILRVSPIMRDEKTIRKIFRQRNYPAGLFEAIWLPVWSRCHELGNPVDWWRKGFAYALVFNGPTKGNWGELRIMPGVYVGPGGVVEAEGFVIRRPENRKFSDREVRRKSKDLRQLAEALKYPGWNV